MGTSHAIGAPNTKKWKIAVAALRSPTRNANAVVGTTVSAAVPLIPPGYVSVPVAIAAYEGLRFAALVKRDGIDSAAEKTSVRLVEKYVAPSISSSLWTSISDRLPSAYGNSVFGKVAETAFKKTLNTVLTKGVEAMEE